MSSNSFHFRFIYTEAESKANIMPPPLPHQLTDLHGGTTTHFSMMHSFMPLPIKQILIHFHLIQTEAESKANIMPPPLPHQITDLHGGTTTHSSMMHSSMPSPVLVDPSLAKPVAMRRLSEKTVAHARASMGDHQHQGGGSGGGMGMGGADTLLNTYSK